MTALRTALTGVRPWAAVLLAAGVGAALAGPSVLTAGARAQAWYEGRPAGALCSFRARTGLPCLACGGTRALHLASRGRLAEAWRVNRLGAWAGLAAWVLAAGATVSLITGRARSLRWSAWALAATAPLAFVAAFVVWWAALPPAPRLP